MVRQIQIFKKCSDLGVIFLGIGYQCFNMCSIGRKVNFLQTSLFEKTIPNLKDAVYHVDESGDRIVVAQEKQFLQLHWSAGDGTIVRKVFGFDPDSYLIDLKFNIQNGTDHLIRDRLAVGIANMVNDEKMYGFVGPSAFIDDSLEQIKIKKIEDDLVALTFTVGKARIEKPGVLFKITRSLAWENINIVEIISVDMEVTFIVSKKDAIKGYRALERLIII